MGIVDGTHCPFKCNSSVSARYFNYKGWTSVTSLVMVDHEYRFTYVLSGNFMHIFVICTFLRSAVYVLVKITNVIFIYIYAGLPGARSDFYLFQRS